ncbi:pancreatic triacylglycerol lipase [Nephila pilipes]|uniref:Pancreatic triacylglycerol lipase n=1 Tax=Nephila pilipes TaxID=299642 RepID=A0A8X6MAR9_NEPPI|nr:pancreatic triacylglycerol lipase [Nephila pilipes]
MDSITEPVLNGLRELEATALRYSRINNKDLKSRHKITRFYLFTPEHSSDGVRLYEDDLRSLRYFNSRLETKVIIHGFLDKVKIADWMRHMKDEFLLLDNFNVIIVDWSFGNFIPYSKAAANTERAGEEIAKLLILLRDQYGARIDKFHLIGHSLGSHVAGYVGERVKGLKRITGLDPAAHLFTNASPRSKLDPSDAEFVDVIHTDGGGIGLMEPVGHVDFYPNGGRNQPGCTTSNSLRALLEKGVVEGVRNVICSHMRATLLFTDTINSHKCQHIAHRCSSWEAFSHGQCDSTNDQDYAVMTYKMDIQRKYGNASTFYLLTSDTAPYCGYEYKITLMRDIDYETGSKRSSRNDDWPTSDILHISLYGSSGNADFKIEGKEDFHSSNVLFSPSFLGDVMGAIIRWSKRPVSRARGVRDVIYSVINSSRPFIKRIYVSSLKAPVQWKIAPIVFELCISPMLYGKSSQQGATFRREYC